MDWRKYLAIAIPVLVIIALILGAVALIDDDTGGKEPAGSLSSLTIRSGGTLDVSAATLTTGATQDVGESKDDGVYHLYTASSTYSPSATAGTNWILCDGTADESDFVTAFKAVHDLGGGVVVAHEGTFVFDAQATPASAGDWDDVELKGMGEGVTTIQYDTTNNAHAFYGGAGDIDNLQFRDLTIQCTDTTNSSSYRAISLGLEEVRIEDCDEQWDTIDGDVTASMAGDGYYHFGDANVFTVDAGPALAAGDMIAVSNLDASDVNISARTNIEFWFYSTVTIASNDLVFRVSENAYIADYNITGVNTGAETFTVAEDLSGMVANDSFVVSGSTGNDGTWTVSGVAGAGPTTITVSEDITDATVDGSIGPPETLNMGAITADTWTLIDLTMANASDLGQVNTIGLEYNANVQVGAFTIDWVCATKNNATHIVVDNVEINAGNLFIRGSEGFGEGHNSVTNSYFHDSENATSLSVYGDYCLVENNRFKDTDVTAITMKGLNPIVANNRFEGVEENFAIDVGASISPTVIGNVGTNVLAALNSEKSYGVLLIEGNNFTGPMNDNASSFGVKVDRVADDEEAGVMAMVTIRDNVFSRFYEGVRIADQDMVLIENNVISECQRYGVLVHQDLGNEATNITIKGNNFQLTPYDTANGRTIIGSETNQNIWVIDNIFTGNSIGTEQCIRQLGAGSRIIGNSFGSGFADLLTSVNTATIIYNNLGLDPSTLDSANYMAQDMPIEATAGAALSFGQTIVLQADGKWDPTDADAGDTTEPTGFVGVCVLAAAGDTSATRVMTKGWVNLGAAPNGSAVGDYVYFDDTTAGTVDDDAPADSTDLVRIAGEYAYTNILHFDPDRSWAVVP